MDKKDFIKLIEDMDIDTVDNFKLDLTLSIGTKITLKNDD